MERLNLPQVINVEPTEVEINSRYKHLKVHGSIN
jgi:hypothetical protein